VVYIAFREGKTVIYKQLMLDHNVTVAQVGEIEV